MRYESLSPVLNKKDDEGNPVPNRVKITNNAYNGKDGPSLEIEFPAELMSYPQFDSFAEFVEDAGGEERALEIINDVTAKFATSSGKAFIRNATTGSEEEIVTAGCKTARDFSWKKEEKLTTKAKADMLDNLASQAENLTPEQLKARFLELLGK